MDKIFSDGTFFIGCNYWASHAGIRMWSDWRADVVESDFRRLKEMNVKYLRVFPLWPDFQPVKMLRQCFGDEKEIRLDEEPMPFTEAGRAGVSQIMSDRFSQFCDIAKKYGIKLIVGLVTGWMSGRLFVPPLLEGKNILCDPLAIEWEIKYVRYMVKTFKNCSAIAAWDLGNECNCLGRVVNSSQAYVWTSAITMAIKCEDSQRPVVSGMHTTFAETEFNLHDLGETLDVVCTHPYPLFTKHCETDPINENKSVFHAVAETVMYRGLSGKPAFVEEAGTLGAFLASKENSAAYANTVMYQLWAHNCLGFMWWCAFEQTELDYAPYDWTGLERELGLFNTDFSAKPIAEVMSHFADFIEEFEHKKLPERIVDAVCILTAQEDSWRSAFGTFLLAKQAGLDVEFRYVTDEIPHARAYIIPSVEGNSALPKHMFNEIMGRVKDEGAVLYLSHSNILFAEFEKHFGLKPLYRYVPTAADKVILDGNEFEFMQDCKMVYEASGAKIIAYDAKRIPVMSEYSYGKGTVYYLTYPIENIAAQVPNVISGENETPYYKFYNAMPQLRNAQRKVSVTNPHISHTEHIVDDNTRIVVAVNCVSHQACTDVIFDGYKMSRVLKNQDAKIDDTKNGIIINMQPNSAIVFEIKK